MRRRSVGSDDDVLLVDGRRCRREKGETRGTLALEVRLAGDAPSVPFKSQNDQARLNASGTLVGDLGEIEAHPHRGRGLHQVWWQREIQILPVGQLGEAVVVLEIFEEA